MDMMVTCVNKRFLTEKIFLPYKPARVLANWLEHIKVGHPALEGYLHGSRRRSTVATSSPAGLPFVFNQAQLDTYQHGYQLFALRNGPSWTEVGYRNVFVAASRRPVPFQS